MKFDHFSMEYADCVYINIDGCYSNFLYKCWNNCFSWMGKKTISRLSYIETKQTSDLFHPLLILASGLFSFSETLIV